ncbi:hypothetical protein AVEN_20847-1 [Araneus ventricosus]|uniref:Uncharacterized protein n=1 Tax=Araneus ventricosus TaxID=182803 RepID=A0A4Y2TPI3_ARAVE|nr:hypothetical protein AVEN_49769-1 [Araneus ventricosus]GBO02001.1 hypothetical protein AVEN_206451-1 [Araneus ventricosus]GBO02007.1 hypothetical protein AVEN_20847-1 [Araneus ventricosus]
MCISQYPRADLGNSFCLVVKIRDSEPKGPRFYPAAKVVTHGQRTRNNFQSHYYMAAPQITSIPYSATSTKWQHYNSYSNAALPIQSL